MVWFFSKAFHFYLILIWLEHVEMKGLLYPDGQWLVGWLVYIVAANGKFDYYVCFEESGYMYVCVCMVIRGRRTVCAVFVCVCVCVCGGVGLIKS